MSRDLDSALQAALPRSLIQPVILAELTFKSGVSYVWSGIGDLTYGGNTYKGIGALGKVSPVQEGVSVQADGVTIALSGLEAIPLVPSTPPSGLTPPVTPSAGQYVAWSQAQSVASYVNPDGGRSVTDLTLTSGTLALSGSHSGETVGVSATWSDFAVPNLPADAVISEIYAVALMSGSGAGVPSLFNPLSLPYPPPYTGQYYGSAGTSLADLEAFSITAQMGASAPGAATMGWAVTGLALAVYYTSASNAFAVMNEALQDIQLGATAKIYFGLLTDGALIGAPYLVFSGQVDQPTVDVDTQTMTISIALENKLSNLARPTARRYTAADQHIAYPDDTGFNFVETLNDIALRWGS